MDKEILVHPTTRESIRRTSNVLVYGTTKNQATLISENLPNKDICVIDCTDCFTDIIAISYIAVIINPDLMTQENIEYFNCFANDLLYYSEKIVFTKPHSILQNLNKNVKCTVFSDDYEFETNIKFVLLEASRSEKRAKAYSYTVSQTIRVLSEIRKHPYITTAELAEKIERSPKTVQRYITTLVCAGEFIEYDRKRRGWFLYENKSILWGDY